MKSSFIILCCFITGILLAYYRYVPDIFLTYDYSNYILPVMMFFVGIGIGGDIKSLYVPIKKYKLKVGSINSIFYFLHKAAEPFNCLEQDNLA